VKNTSTMVTVIFSVRARARPRIPTPLRLILSMDQIKKKLKIRFLTSYKLKQLKSPA
jgi:hypothetical protein